MTNNSISKASAPLNPSSRPRPPRAPDIRYPIGGGRAEEGEHVQSSPTSPSSRPRSRYEPESSDDLDRDRAEGQFVFGTGLLDEASTFYLTSLLDRMTQSNEFLYVYILANQIGVLYIGMTNNLSRRLHEHRAKLNKGFTSNKNCFRLVYFEIHTSPEETITREKQIKSWRREKKERLIKSLNPPWIDLAPFLPLYQAPADYKPSLRSTAIDPSFHIRPEGRSRSG